METLMVKSAKANEFTSLSVALADLDWTANCHFNQPFGVGPDKRWRLQLFHFLQTSLKQWLKASLEKKVHG